MSGPLLGLPAAVDDIYKELKSGFPLQNELGWAGGRFPFAGASDVTISSNTTWSDAIGYKKVKKLTINASCTLTISKTPFIIFADEIVGGGSGAIIDISGPSGSTIPTAGQVYSNDFAWGHPQDQGSARMVGGCGGGLLIICCRKFSGTAITIKADGGAGYTSGTVTSGGLSHGGVGAAPFFNRNISGSTPYIIDPLGFLLVPNSGTSLNSAYGGPAVESTNGLGGSGIGQGGNTQTSLTAPIAALSTLTIKNLIDLALAGCKGGGGGGTRYQAPNVAAAGGGGGGIGVIVNDVSSVTPSMQANGGAKAGNDGGSMATDGAAGKTILINLAT